MHIMMISQVSSVTNISHPETLEKPRDLTLFDSNLNLFYFVNNQGFSVKIPLAHFFSNQVHQSLYFYRGLRSKIMYLF